MYELPTSVKVGDIEYNIQNKGDYRVIFDVMSALNDLELNEWQRVITALVIFFEDFTLNNISEILNTEDLLNETIKGMYSFIECGQKNFGAKQNYKVIDWEQDSQIIFHDVI